MDIQEQNVAVKTKQQDFRDQMGSFCGHPRCVIDHGPGDCRSNIPEMNLQDDSALRWRHKEIFSLSNDDEVLYLFSGTYVRPNKIPFGYATTGAQVISRSNRIYFREYFLKNYEKEEFVKTTMDIFLILKRNFVFNHKGEVSILITYIRIYINILFTLKKAKI